jgi:hypothetical protein
MAVRNRANVTAAFRKASTDARLPKAMREEAARHFRNSMALERWERTVAGLERAASVIALPPITRQKATEAALRLRRRSNLANPLNPQLIVIGVELAATYMRAGAASFDEVSRIMLKDLSEMGVSEVEAHPYFHVWYAGAFGNLSSDTSIAPAASQGDQQLPLQF